MAVLRVLKASLNVNQLYFNGVNFLVKFYTHSAIKLTSFVITAREFFLRISINWYFIKTYTTNVRKHDSTMIVNTEVEDYSITM